MSAALTRLQLRKHPRTCAKPNAPQPTAGWLLAAFVVGVLAAAVALDAPNAIATICAAMP